MFIYYFFKREKKCICGAFQQDAAVPEKQLYFFLALIRSRLGLLPVIFSSFEPKAHGELL